MPTIVISENSVRDYTGVTDTQIKQNAPTTNYNGDEYMEATSWDTGDTAHALMFFAAPSLGSTVTVSSCTLEVRLESYTAGTRDISLFKLLRGTHAATWNTHDGTNNWTTAGGLSNGNDYDSTALATTSVSDTAGYKSWSGASLETYVQAQLNAGNPIRLMLHRTARTAHDFKSNNFSQSGHTDGTRPKLTIVYTVSSAIVTDVDTDEAITSNQTNVVVTGTGFEAVPGTGTVTLRQGSTSVVQSIDSWSATSIQFDTVFDSGAVDLKHGAATLRVTTNGAAIAELAITINQVAGTLFRDLTSIFTTAGERITSVADLVIGDQLHARGVGGGAAPNGLVLGADATYYFNSGFTPVSFEVRAWDSTDSSWGAYATQTVPGAYTLTVDASTYAYSVVNVNLARNLRLLVTPAVTYPYSVVNVDFQGNPRRLTVDPLTYTYSVLNVRVARPNTRMLVDPVVYQVTVQDVGLTAPGQLLAAPSNLSIVTQGPKFVELRHGVTFRNSSRGVSYYKMYVNGTWDGVILPSIPGVSTLTVFKGNLIPRTAYSFKVSAVDSFGIETGFSNTVSITTPSNSDVGRFRPRRYQFR